MYIKKITHNYSNFTLDINSIKLPQNKVIGLIGRNGAGKTTLMDILSQTVYANAAFEVEEYYSEDIMYIPSELEPYEYLTVKEFGKIVLEYSSSESNLDDLIYQLDLIDQSNIEISELSQGQRKKLSLINLYLNEYSLVILDEPFNSIDLQYTFEIKDIINKLKETSTILVSSHVVDTLSDICDEFIYLDNGKIKKHFQNTGNKQDLEEELLHEDSNARMENN